MVLYYSRFFEGENMDKTLLWVWLSLLFGADKLIYKKIYENYGIDKAYDFDDADMDIAGASFTDYEKRNLLDKNLKQAEEIVDWCEKAGVKIITLDSSNYPKRLLKLERYPGVLYCRGELPDIDKTLCITVVGTRNHSVYGERLSYEMGYGLTKGGALVISGGALGIDATAQKGALLAEGKTITVLGSGIDVIYPKQNKDLILETMEKGVVITEYPPHSPADAFHFPQRNRIMAALANAVLVVEGKERSGALITARIAKELDVEVFAVPGPVTQATSKAPNQLIADGAHVAMEAIDVLEQFLDVYGNVINISASKQKPSYGTGEIYEPKPKNKLISLFKRPKKSEKPVETKQEEDDKKVELDLSAFNAYELKVYNFMQSGVSYNLDMFEDLDLSIAILSSTLTMLEMKKAISALPGGRYIKKI